VVNFTTCARLMAHAYASRQQRHCAAQGPWASAPQPACRPRVGSQVGRICVPLFSYQMPSRGQPCRDRAMHAVHAAGNGNWAGCMVQDWLGADVADWE
jgi:hypothetical protein